MGRNLYFLNATLAAAAVLLIACSGCTRYSAKPLDPVAVQQQIQRVSLDDLVNQTAESAVAGTLKLAPSEGLDADAAGLAALLLNPGLKTKRLERGVAAGQIITAGLYPNPSLDNRFLPFNGQGRGVKSFEANLSFEVLRWNERAGEKQAKQANMEAVQFEIMAEEWKTVSEARADYWNVVAAREKLRVNQEALDLSERLTTGVRNRVAKGAGNAFELNLAELQHVKLQAETRKLEAEASAAERALRQAIGLPFEAELKLRIPEKPLARGKRAWGLPEVLSALTNTAGMKAVEWEYQEREGELRAAIARQYPGLRLGPSTTLDFDGNVWSSLFGFVAALELPVLNHNQGEVKEKLAAREQAYAAYVERLHVARSAIADAVAQAESSEKGLLFQEQELLPKAQETIRLTERACAAGEIEASALLQAQASFLEVKKNYLDLLIEYRHGLQAVEAALGRRLEDLVAGTEKK